MDERDELTRRRFLTTGAAGAAILAARSEAVAQAPGAAQKLHVKPVPAEIFIDHGINQETRLETLRGYLTPASHFFVRSHAASPVLDARTWRLRVEGDALERSLELTFDDLLRLPSRSVICFVECAGNGRGFFKEFMGKVAAGTQWRLGGIGVAEWTGVPLGAVLELAGVKRDVPRDILNVLVEGLGAGGGSPSRARLRVAAGRPHHPCRGEPGSRDHLAPGSASRAQHRPRLGPLGVRLGGAARRSRDPDASHRRQG